MSEYLGTKTAMVVAPGMYMKCADRLARDFKRVLYHDPFWQSAFPKFTDAQVGENLLEVEGVEKVNNFWDYVDEVDLFVFPDCGYSDWSDYLISIGKRCWASGKADSLELLRIETLEYFKELGLPTPKYQEVKGLDALRIYLQKHKDVYVKLDIFRGSVESFHSADYDLIMPLLDKLEGELGPVKNRMVFSVFQPIEGIELAADLYTVNGQFPSKVALGFEVKDMGWACKIMPYEKLFEPIKDFNAKISETLKINNYRNFFSAEMRVNDKGVGYVTDCCCRQPSPVSEAYYELISNFSEILYYGGNNEFIEPIYAENFAMTLVITCDFAMEHWVGISFPKEIAKYVKLRNYTIVDDVYYVVPNTIDKNDCIGVVVMIGKSLDDCAVKINKVAEQIKGYRVKIPCAVVSDIQDEIKKAIEIGVTW